MTTSGSNSSFYIQHHLRGRSTAKSCGPGVLGCVLVTSTGCHHIVIEAVTLRKPQKPKEKMDIVLTEGSIEVIERKTENLSLGKMFCGDRNLSLSGICICRVSCGFLVATPVVNLCAFFSGVAVGFFAERNTFEEINPSFNSSAHKCTHKPSTKTKTMTNPKNNSNNPIANGAPKTWIQQSLRSPCSC